MTPTDSPGQSSAHRCEPASISFDEPPERRRTFQGIPGIAATGTRLWAVWYGGGAGEAVGNHLMLSSSDEHGRWDAPWMFVQVPPPRRAFDPTLWTDPAGRLWLFWAECRITQPEVSAIWDGRGGVWASVCAEPDSAPRMWSQPRRLSDGVMLNKPIVTATGEWFLPVSIWKRPPLLRELAARRKPGVVASTDGGATFDWRGGASVRGSHFDEHQVLQRDDGSLELYVRHDPWALASRSDDGGRTWTDGEPTSIPCPDSRFHLSRLASGRWLLITHPAETEPARHGSGRRRDLTAWLSEDEGQTWTGGLVLFRDPDVSYPDASQDQNGRIHVIYDYNRYADRVIALASVTEDDILAGRLVSRRSRLHRVVDAGGAARAGRQPAGRG